MNHLIYNLQTLSLIDLALDKEYTMPEFIALFPIEIGGAMSQDIDFNHGEGAALEELDTMLFEDLAYIFIELEKPTIDYPGLFAILTELNS